MTEETVSGRTVVGRVVSDKMEKSISVLVETREQHPIYKKYLRRSTKFHAHDAGNECRIGDLVRIEECRPLSKTKTWRLVEVIERVGG
ncbi:30S ribosomal protein S17 [Immundisolibacter cernigliae]|uniref:Small ribosomal subunit protein uS17 n=1 Tax=Immundisolibacter cernigliae TaxID=1810504 RepID=A0A1B1YVQ4_9GAMM|nr:30S ribosomal protein S17 [Immundisolibacter cernigliae]ANX04768.1 30S ribosomal protein S17 [Immundisolibacter cernigliae]